MGAVAAREPEPPTVDPKSPKEGLGWKIAGAMGSDPDDWPNLRWHLTPVKAELDSQGGHLANGEQGEPATDEGKRFLVGPMKQSLVVISSGVRLNHGVTMAMGVGW